MPTPLELRNGARLYREGGRRETEPHLKHRLASHALALAQLAEKTEREEKTTKPPTTPIQRSARSSQQ